MSNYVIITDSCSGLTGEHRKQYDIEYVQNHISFDGKSYPASLDWEYIPAHDYYEMIKNGTRVITSQVNQESYHTAFENALSKGCDVLSISCSSALSNSVKSSYLVRDELKKKYPDRKIICIDSLISCYGLGMLVMQAAKMRAEGKSIDEAAQWVEDHKLEAQMYGTVNDLKCLKLSGRITATAALFGTLLNIKPIITSDAKGQNVSIAKIKGRKASLEKMLSIFKESYTNVPYQCVHINHADCIEDAEYLKEELAKIAPNVPIHISYLEPTVGASVGQSMIALFFYAKPRTLIAQ